MVLNRGHSSNMGADALNNLLVCLCPLSHPPPPLFSSSNAAALNLHQPLPPPPSPLHCVYYTHRSTHTYTHLSLPQFLQQCSSLRPQVINSRGASGIFLV